jgi:hypothetical protein
MRDEGGSAVSSENYSAGEGLSFAAFVLTHVECGGVTVELRIGDGLLLEWCPTCAVLETFGAPGG